MPAGASSTDPAYLAETENKRMKYKDKWSTATLRKVLLPLLCILTLVSMPLPGHGEERTVSGTITRLDPASQSFSVRDGMGVVWNYMVGRDSGIDLGQLRIGDYVTVTLARATPLNMTTPADMLREGDSVVRFPAK
jgi:hypothetical protein